MADVLALTHARSRRRAATRACHAIIVTCTMRITIRALSCRHAAAGTAHAGTAARAMAGAHAAASATTMATSHAMATRTYTVSSSTTMATPHAVASATAMAAPAPAASFRERCRKSNDHRQYDKPN